MKREEKLRNGAYDAEFQMKASGHETPVPPVEQHPEWSIDDHRLIHRFLKAISRKDVEDDEVFDMVLFHEEYLRWAKKNARIFLGWGPETFSSEKAFWELVETKIGEVPKSGEIHWATLQDQIFLNYSSKVLLDEFIWGLNNIKGPSLAALNFTLTLLIDMAKLHEYFLKWCSVKKAIPRSLSEYRLVRVLLDKKLFWDRLKQKGLNLPQSGLVSLGELEERIYNTCPEEPIKY